MQEYFHLLETEFFGLQQQRDEVLAGRLNEELNKAAEELGGLEDTLKEAKKAKEEWEATDERLKKAKQEADAG